MTGVVNAKIEKKGWFGLKSVVCEMIICSLRNDNLLSRCVYSDILNREFSPKKPFRPENSDCAECVRFSLPRIKIKLSSGAQVKPCRSGLRTGWVTNREYRLN